MIDASKAPDEEDFKIYESIQDKNVIVLLNKSDLGCSKNPFPQADTISISAKTGTGLDSLSKMIQDKFKLGEISASSDAVITNLRHKEAIHGATDAITRAIEAFHAQVSYDLISIDVIDTVNYLGEITGKTVSEEVVDKIFARFCLGK